MTDPIKPMAEYEKAFDTISPRLAQKVAEQAREMTDTYLLMFDQPGKYPQYRHIVSAAMDSMLVWLVSEGFVTLNEEWTTTAEEAVVRSAERASRGSTPPVDELTARRQRNDGGYV